MTVKSKRNFNMSFTENYSEHMKIISLNLLGVGKFV
jgi:hypothetical protein